MRYVCSESSGSRIFSGMRANRRKLASRCCRLHSFLLPGNHSHDVIINNMQKLSWASLSEWQWYLDTVSYKTIQRQPKVILHILFPDFMSALNSAIVFPKICVIFYILELVHYVLYLPLLNFYVLSCLNSILNFLIRTL